MNPVTDFKCIITDVEPVPEPEIDAYESDGFDVNTGHAGNVEDERHVHVNRHVHQVHSPDDPNTVIRTENINESIDVTDHRDPSRNKHYDTHWKIKQSSQDSGGFIGALKRFTTRDKSKVKGNQETRLKSSIPIVFIIKNQQ